MLSDLFLARLRTSPVPMYKLATEAGAVHIGGIALHLRGEVRDIFFDWLRAQQPDLILAVPVPAEDHRGRFLGHGLAPSVGGVPER